MLLHVTKFMPSVALNLIESSGRALYMWGCQGGEAQRSNTSLLSSINMEAVERHLDDLELLQLVKHGRQLLSQVSCLVFYTCFLRPLTPADFPVMFGQT